MADSSLPSQVYDLRGRRFGRLLVRGYSEKRKKHHYWLCQCDCGNVKAICGGNLTRNLTRSCGCLHREMFSALFRKHGHTRIVGSKWSAEYGTWLRIKGRCYNKNNNRYQRYGARGIKVCDRWLHGDGSRGGFECFLSDMWPRPARHSIERKDNDRDYEPSNTKWATKAEQARNTSVAHRVIFNGEEKSLADVADITGIRYHTLRKRLKSGWTLERATTQPVRSRRLAK